MFCSKCGNELKNEALFCSKCGASVAVPVATLEMSSKAGQNQSSPRQLKKAPTVAACIAAVAVAAVAVIALVVGEFDFLAASEKNQSADEISNSTLADSSGSEGASVEGDVGEAGLRTNGFQAKGLTLNELVTEPPDKVEELMAGFTRIGDAGYIGLYTESEEMKELCGRLYLYGFKDTRASIDKQRLENDVRNTQPWVFSINIGEGKGPGNWEQLSLEDVQRGEDPDTVAYKTYRLLPDLNVETIAAIASEVIDYDKMILIEEPQNIFDGAACSNDCYIVIFATRVEGYLTAINLVCYAMTPDMSKDFEEFYNHDHSDVYDCYIK